MNPKLPSLSSFFSPEGVAIIGASEEIVRLGGRPLSYMARYKYRGRVYPVHPKHKVIQGYKAYPNISAIPDSVELAIIVISASWVESVLLEGIENGIKAFIVFSSGYAEMGKDGLAAQQRLSDICQSNGVLLLGPNCMGCADTRSRMIASFSTAMETSSLKRGRFALVTQSGALGSYWMAMVDRQGLGFSKFLTTGNEAGVDLAQGIAYLADDNDTDVIGVYIESIKDITTFRAAALKAAMAGKTIVAIKAGRSSAGAEAAASHTGSLAGEDAIYQAFFDQFGIVRVDSLSEMIDAAKLLIKQPLPAGRRVGIVTISGGAGALLADELADQGLTTPDFSTQSKAILDAMLPDYIQARNPLDHTGAVAGDPQLFDNVIKAVGQVDDHDAYIIFSGLLDSLASQLVSSIETAFAGSDKQLGVIWLGASPAVLRQLEEAGIPVFADIPQAARAFGQVAHAVKLHAQAGSLNDRVWPPLSDSAVATRNIVEYKAAERIQVVSNIEFPEQRLIERIENLPCALELLQYPLAAKLQSESMPHRSEHGAVVLGLYDEQGVRQATESLLALASSKNIECDGILLQEMHEISYELIVGIKTDAQFGPLLLIGRGGIDVELRPDTKTALLPLQESEVKSMLLALQSAELLNGYRGRPAIDIDNLAQMLKKLGDGFLADDELLELEINPLAITKQGKVLALDALARLI